MGMKKGLELKILRPGKEIIDPDTRVAIGRSKDKVLGKCRIETVSKSLSIAVPVEGQGFQVGDIVRLLEDARPTVNTSKPAEACETNEAKPNSNSK